MAKFSFEDILNYFSEHLLTEVPEGDLRKEGIEIEIGGQNVVIFPSSQEGGLSMTVTLGLMLKPIPDKHLNELMCSNFLGVNTGGCTLCLDKEGVCLALKALTTPGTTPQESWEWLHRLLAVAAEWMKTLYDWEEFIPLYSPPEKKKTAGMGEKV